MTAGVVDQEFWRLAEERQPGRLVQVHGCTGTLCHDGELVGYPRRRTKPVQATEQRGGVIIHV